ncbi:MAG: MBL fold metallo-hydrolase [Verrucomicrobia bacterium]|nr:MBL fold metallo-hydrolase [Verrucomicrobiota bacterium]
MTDAATLTFLGTGTSVGVPVIGCGCGVCASEDPRNRRLRSSVVLRAGGVTLLVDSGPDLRAQALREGLRAVDGVLYTHPHLDHVAGFDELRAFCWHRSAPLPLHGTDECLNTLKTMFAWAFSPENQYAGYVKPDPHVVDGPFYYGDLRITPLPVEHAAVETIGYRFDLPGMRSLAYVPDVKRIPDTTMNLLRGVDVLVIDSLRPKPHPTHFSLAEALAASEEIGARETWLTHLGHENDHADLSQGLPDGVRVAWDGLKVSLESE